MRDALPIHPRLCHPLTGEPLRAVGLRRNGAPIWPVMGASEPAPETPPANPPADPPADPAGPPADPDADPPGADDLGAAGKRALDAMKGNWKTARDLAATEKARADSLQAKIDGKEAEHAAAEKAREVESAALAKANERILKAEVRVAAAGKLSDPADALRFLDLSDFEVGSDGEVDADALATAIDDLVKKKPYLAAQGGKRFQGTADGGARNESAKSIDQQIAEASAAGNHALAITLKRQKAYANTDSK